MAIRSLGFSGCCQAIILLAVSLPAYSAYTPPATPDLPLSYEFLGSNAEAESTAFYNTQCDSNNFSWRGVDWACAVGDPANPICYVKMAYHATDVNKCQDSGGTDPENPDPENPDPENPDPDSLQASNPHILHPTAFTTELKDIHKDLGIVYDAILKGARQASYTKTAIDMQTGSIARDLAELTRHVDASGDGIYTVLQEMRTDINSQTNWVSQNQMILAESKNLLKSIESKMGSGSGSGDGNNYADYNPALNHIANSIGELSSLSNIVNNTSQIGAINNILSGSINNNLAKIAGEIGKPQDNSAIIQQLVEANDGLTDIVIRMRDIENAIGKSEKGIVDAIKENGSGGQGSDPDAISETGCAAFSCSSNTPQCYIARKEWERSCAATKNETDAKGLVDSLTSSVKDYNASPDSDIQNIDAGTINTNTLMQHYNESNGFSSSGASECPPPYTVDIVISVITIDLSPFCQLASVIKWFVIAFATVGAGLMISKYS
ncbi:hypothetical protein KFE26_22985 [Shewanella sp. M16]|uniref:virulence factor TspB C-terminal domain-related protein n=1 Tax=Shewanella sp. M16 TaxID=2830837 RepID=UPI001BAF3E10|nr:virulence factor TspB C-terminal domain-related protein [Shewanella sp. M16]MBS0045116.1 hypothetical protein [Shewanella sp. M16]